MTLTIDFMVKRASAAKWKSKNPVLKAGQIGFEKDSRQLKIGDGSAAWNSLPYVVLKNNLSATADPKTTDCAGYSAGSLWFNHLNGWLWVCKSNTGTVAAWTQMAAGYGS